MRHLNQILSLLDQGIDTNFVATLAGLSLAAVAFFIPSSDKIINDAKKEKEDKENTIEIGINKEKVFTNQGADTQKRVEELNNIIKSVTDAHSGLLKAFIIFSWLLVYTITIDQILDEKTIIEFFPGQNSIFIEIGETFFSFLLLTFAGVNLWKGVMGIKKYYNVNFDEERTKAIEGLRKLKTK